MDLQILKIYLSTEFADDKENNHANYTDVIVVLNNGGKYVASFFTYESILELHKKHQKSGAFLRGKYFWADAIVLIENASREVISEVVQYLVEEGDFMNIFKKIN